MAENNNNGKINIEAPLKKLTGVGFYMVVMLAIIKDISDIFLNLSIVFSFFVIFSGLIISFIVFFYLFLNNVDFITKYGSKKLVILITSFIIEIVPFLSIIPVFTFTLFLIKAIENNEQLKKFNESLLKLKII